MSRVGITFKIYPEEGQLDSAIDGIKREMNPAAVATEDIGFGIKVIKVLIKFEDTETSSSKLEEKIRSIKGVNEIEVESETLI